MAQSPTETRTISANQAPSGSAPTGPQKAELATTAEDVYADVPFAGTAFEESGSGRSWIGTYSKENPTTLGELLSSEQIEGTLLIECHSGETIKLEVDTKEETPQPSQRISGTQRDQLLEEGKRVARKEAREERTRLEKRHRQRIELKDERLQQKENRIQQLQEQLRTVRQRKEEQIERERDRRRDREEELEEKYKSRIEELEEKLREKKEKILELKNEKDRGVVGEVVDLVKEDSEIRGLLSQSVTAQSDEEAQPGQSASQVASQTTSQVASQAQARGDGAPAQQEAATQPPQGGHSPPAQGSKDVGGAVSEESPGQNDSTQNGSTQNGSTQNGSVSSGGKDGKARSVGVVAKDCIEAVYTGQAQQFSQKLRATERVKTWGAEEWLTGLHAIALIGAENEIPIGPIGDFIAHELPYWATESVMEQVRAAQALPASQVAEKFNDYLEENTGSTAGKITLEFVGRVVERLQKHDL